MNKRQAIRIITNSAKLYKENLEDKKILFLYGVPKEINEEICMKRQISNIIKSDKNIDIKEISFSERIENLLERPLA